MRISLGVLVLMAGVAGCDGGSETPPVSSGPATTISYDSSVSPATQLRIQAINTAAGAVGSGAATIEVPTIPAGGDVAVMATDANGDLVLAGYASSTATSLSHESTANFLARLRLGQLVSSGQTTRAILNAAIAGSPALPSLVSELSGSLAAGVAPIKSDAVLLALSRVVADVQLKVAPSMPTLISRAQQLSARPYANTPPPLPYALVPSAQPGTISAVLLNDMAGANVSLLNNSLLGWSYASTDLAGLPLQAPKILEGISFWSSFYKVIVDGRLNEPQTVNGNGTQFVVTAALDPPAVGYNVGMITVDLVSIGLSEVLGKEYKNLPTCASRVAMASITDKLPALLVTPTIGNLRTYLLSMFNDALASKNTLEGFATCLVGYTDPPNPLLGGALSVIARANVAIDIYTLSSRLNQLATFASTPVRSVEICKQGGAVVPCALSIASPSKLLAAYQSMPLTAMVTARNAPYAAPSDLIWELVDGSAFATLDSSGLLTAKYGAGEVNLRVTSKYGDVATYLVQTYVPAISPPSQTIKVSQTAALSLVDPNGAPAVLRRAWNWSSSQMGIASIDPASGVVTAISPGTARVFATDPDHPLSVGAPIEVLAKDLIAVTLLLDSSPNPSPIGLNVTLNATVIRSIPSAASLTGAVQVRDLNGKLYCGMLISDTGTGQCTATFPTAGSFPIVGTYGGNGDFSATSAGSTHTVSCIDADTILAQGPWGTIKRKGCAALKRGGSVAFTDLIEYSAGTDGASWGYVNIYAPGATTFSLSGGFMPAGYNNAYVIGNVWGSGNADLNCMAGAPDASSYSSIRIAVPSTYTGSSMSVGTFYFRYQANCYIYAAGTDGLITFPVID